MLKNFNITGIFIYLFRWETSRQFHFHVYLKKRCRKRCGQSSVFFLMLFIYYMHHRKKQLKPWIQILNFTCQYKSSDLSIFHNVALGARHVILAHDEASFSFPKHVLYDDYAPVKAPVINFKPTRSLGHLVITTAALPLVIVLQLRQVNGKMFFKHHKHLIVQYLNECH